MDSTIFVSYDQSEWLPKKSHLLCWWCCHSFDWNRFPLPVREKRVNDNGHHKIIYTVVGNFCSANCAKAYAMDKRMFGRSSHWIDNIATNMYGVKDKFSSVAPSRECINSFTEGGITINDFRKSSTGKKNKTNQNLTRKKEKPDIYLVCALKNIVSKDVVAPNLRKHSNTEDTERIPETKLTEQHLIQVPYNFPVYRNIRDYYKDTQKDDDENKTK